MTVRVSRQHCEQTLCCSQRYSGVESPPFRYPPLDKSPMTTKGDSKKWEKGPLFRKVLVFDVSRAVRLAQFRSGCRKRSAAKGVRSLFFVFGMLSVTFRSLILMLLSFILSLFCQTPFAGLLLRQGEFKSVIRIAGRIARSKPLSLWGWEGVCHGRAHAPPYKGGSTKSCTSQRDARCSEHGTMQNLGSS